jgi:tol-pal system protein YbgF
MRTRTVVLSLALLIAGAIGGAMLAPPAADAVSREMIELQQSVATILQNQQDMRNDIDSRFAVTQTLIKQANDATTQLSLAMGSLQKTFQDNQASSGANSSSLAQQVSSVSDNLQEMQARLDKLAQQMTDIQSTLQTINAKVSTPAPATSQTSAPNTSPDGPGTQQPMGSQPAGTQPAMTQPASLAQPSAGLQPISGDTLYSNAVRDYNSHHYDLSRQELSDYLRSFPDGPYAPDAQFYLGEMSYLQGAYNSAISSYDKVIVNYRRSRLVAPAMLEKGRALAELGKRTRAEQEFRQVIRMYPGTAEAKRAQDELRRLPKK